VLKSFVFVLREFKYVVFILLEYNVMLLRSPELM
jgi:hypothetical protein